MMYLNDIYVDESLTEKLAGNLQDLHDKIIGMTNSLNKEAPVRSVNGKRGDVLLTKADFGLGNVDNTSDMDKPVSNPFKSYVDSEYQSKIKEKYDDMNSNLAPYQFHIIGNAGFPITNNPHVVLLKNGIYHNGELIYLDPATFVDPSVVADNINTHNEDRSAHTILMKLVDRNSSTYRAIIQLEDKISDFLVTMTDQVRDVIDAPLSAHNTNNNSHQALLDSINKQFLRISEIGRADESPYYEYPRRKKTSISLTDRYTDEYPAVNALKIFDNIRSTNLTTELTPIRPQKIVFDTNRSTIIFIYYDPDADPVDDSDNNFDGGDGRIIDDPYTVKSFQVSNSFDIMYPTLALLGSAYDVSDIPDQYIGLESMIFILGMSNTIAWKNYNYDTMHIDDNWGKFVLKLGPDPDPRILTQVEYTESSLNESQIISLYPQCTMCGIYFNKYLINVYCRPKGSFYTFRQQYIPKWMVQTIDIHSEDSVSSSNMSYRNPDNRVINIGYCGSGKNPNLQIQSFDLNNEASTENPIKIGQSLLDPTNIMHTYSAIDITKTGTTSQIHNNASFIVGGIGIQGLWLGIDYNNGDSYIPSNVKFRISISSGETNKEEISYSIPEKTGTCVASIIYF